jgi:hypothetical protein
LLAAFVAARHLLIIFQLKALTINKAIKKSSGDLLFLRRRRALNEFISAINHKSESHLAEHVFTNMFKEEARRIFRISTKISSRHEPKESRLVVTFLRNHL